MRRLLHLPMNIDFFDKTHRDHAEDCVLLLSGFDFSGAITFCSIIESLIHNAENENCVGTNKQGKLMKLDFCLGNDFGIRRLRENHFKCELTLVKYHEMLVLALPYTKNERLGFQYLYDLSNPIEFILSPSGIW